MFTDQQSAVFDAILSPTTTFLAVETVHGSGVISLLIAARMALKNQGFGMYGLASSLPAIKLLNEAIPSCSNAFTAIEQHFTNLSQQDWTNTVLVIEDASRLTGDHFGQLIEMACEMGFAKVILFFTNTFGLDLRSTPKFQGLETAGMPVFSMTQIVRA